MPTFSFIDGDITSVPSQPTMSAESAFAQRISPQQSQDTSNKENEQDLLTEVSRTWTAGKSAHQTKQAKAAVKRARQRGLAPSKIAKHVAYALGCAGEEERVKKFVYNINKEMKKENNKAASQKGASNTSEAEESLATDLSWDKLKPDAPTNVTELISVGIPYQQNGSIFLQGHNLNNKRKVSALEQSSMKESKKHMDVESMTQERHCMTMWQDARAELKKMREELKIETDAKVLAELKSDIECLKRKKEEWAMLLGMKEA